MQDDVDEDLYGLASEAADAEMEQADEVLKEDERKYGEQWLTWERLIAIMAGWGVLQLVALVLVVRDLRRKKRRWHVIMGWFFAILFAGFFAALVYWIIQKLTKRLNKVAASSDL